MAVNLYLAKFDVNRYIDDVRRVTDPDLALLQAAADPTRLAILRQLSTDGPTCACDLTDCCQDLSQPTISHHLKVLREAGWIEGERRGTWIWYAIRPDAVRRFSAIAGGIQAAGARPAGALASSTEPRRLPVVEGAWRQW
jgi:DNA-binding transcriptional ArsR family regulator